MKVSIAIPCYKQAEYLPEAIESALLQTHYDIEVIVVNDGSPDNTEEVARKYPVRLINQVNKGLAAARNTAVMNMTGDYFLPLDADDKLGPECVDRIVEVARQEHPDVIAPSIRTFGLAEQDIILMPSPTLKDFKDGNRLSYCSAIKRRALLDVGGYSTRMDEGYEDLHLWINLLTRGYKIHTIPEVLVYYRTKENSMWKDAVNTHHHRLMAQIIKDFPNAYAS